MAAAQGGHLNRQKAIKDGLADEALKDTPVAEAIAKVVRETKLDFVKIPGTRRGEGRAGKVAKAEAKAAQAEKKADALKRALIEQYRLVPKASRAKFAESLVASGALTQEELDEANAA